VIDVTDDDPRTDVTPADDHLGDPAHVSESLEADAAEVAEQVDAHPDADHHLADEAADFTPEQIDALVAERDEFLDAYRRTAADFDNYRKQVQKRIADEVARTQGGFVERLLPVLDAVEAAEVHGGGDGVEALSGALFGFLEKEGLERVSPTGEAFDPNVAEAVIHEPGEGEPTVVEVLRTGYVWQGRVIRPAMVKVAG
jgi:molecular chaperone GrpE